MDPNADRLFALDLFRFFAALGVVLYHFTAKTPDQFGLLTEVTKFGYLGVPVFFMISGFVISLSTDGRSAYQFAVSRFARLYPGLWVCVLFTVVACYFLAGERFSLSRILANMTLLNEYLGHSDLDVVYWTLKAELKFYACVFLLVLFGAFQKIRIWLSAWLLLSALHLFTEQPSFMGWFISPAWSPFFIMGVAIYHMRVHGPELFNIAVFGSAMILGVIRNYLSAGGFITNPDTLDVLISTTLLAVSALVLIFIAMGRVRLKEAKWVLVAGGITYPLYLIHNRAGQNLIEGPLSSLSEGFAVVVALASALVFSYLIYRFAEKPMGHWVKGFCGTLPDRLALRLASLSQTASRSSKQKSGA